MTKYFLNYLDELEAEAVFVLREVYAQFQNPVILFSGGKDSGIMLNLTLKYMKENNITEKIGIMILVEVFVTIKIFVL